MGGTSESDSNSSSGEEDGDVEWRKAIDSVAATTSSYVSSAISSAANHSSTPAVDGDDGRSHKPKHYQIKVSLVPNCVWYLYPVNMAQKILDEILEKTLVMVKEDPIYAPDIDALSDGGEGSEPMSNGGGIRLFKNSTPGIVLDHIDEPQQPRKRPKILPGKEIDEKSKKFKKRLQSVAVGGEDIMAAARDASRKSVERLQSKEIAAKEAVRREEERVAELKRVRGERWLPSIARDMKLNSHY
ncbi:hypothetical protein TIFTF001_004632 [Ficus carica]|uniref:Uncharacterized protein n=1 Tax=Ficus carica TaxID=3494 RepID=A0AA88CWB8_FICCA|nr:hypothetical protein TIFTF001_004632 [Ficus carica]